MPSQTIEKYIMNIEISKIRHPKEKLYHAILLTIATVLWLVVLLYMVKAGIAIVFILVFYGLMIAGFDMIMKLIWKSMVFSNNILLTEHQHSDIYEKVKGYSGELGLKKIPHTFIINGEGLVNAVAMHILHSKYVFLLSDLVDLYLSRNKKKELDFVIGHELGHHVLGHTNPYLNFYRGIANPAVMIWGGFILIYASIVLGALSTTGKLPSNISPGLVTSLMPFSIFLIIGGFLLSFLHNAYRRACELSCDRVGYALAQDKEASLGALVAITNGTESIASETNIDAFIEQEKTLPKLFTFIYQIFSTYPRMTLRLIKLKEYCQGK